MVLTRYGLREWLAATVVAAVVAAGLLWLGWWWGVIPVAAVWLSVLWFFRDPLRRVPPCEEAGFMLCPADGRVSVEIPAHASGLFEAAGTESPGDAVAVAVEPTGMTGMPVMVEAYDGSGSGLGGGLLLGALAALICVAIISIVGVTGASPALAESFASNLWVWFGGLLGITIVLGLVGMFVGKASE